MSKGAKDPFDGETVLAFLTVVGAQLGAFVAFPGRPDVQPPTNPQELLQSIQRGVAHIRESRLGLDGEDLERLHFLFGLMLQIAFFPNLPPADSDDPS